MSEILLGVSPDAPVETNENGGKQSASPYAFELVPPHAIFKAAEVLKYGATKYGETFDSRNYVKIDSKSHLNHALQHIYAYLAGDVSDDHLAHALVRMMFAVDMDHRENLTKYAVSKDSLMYYSDVACTSKSKVGDALR